MSSLDPILHHPLFGIALTCSLYLAADFLWRRFETPALLHPVLIAAACIAAILFATGFSYRTYAHQTLLLTEGLGVVIVLLAVPLTRQARLIARAGSPLAISLVVGSSVAVATALAAPAMLGASHEVMATLAPKSTTAAVAVEISARIGGAAGLTAVVVISTGVFGAIFGPAILDAVGVEDERARGFALGVASHAIGTARAFQISEVTGAFASLGMILNALLTIALVPVVMSLIGS